MPEAAQVRQMFACVADRYDLVNHLLSAGIDRRWRRAAVRLAAVEPSDCVLDVCTGTGDLSLALAGLGARVTGSDFCPEMLRRARAKAGQGAGAPCFVTGDTCRLPFLDQSFDLVTVAFGIRNLEDPLEGLLEMRRVTRPGGRLVVLEFCRPRLPFIRQLYLFYFRSLLPRLGSWVSGDRQGAYSYLPASVMAFPEREEFLEFMTKAGLQSPQQRILSCGIAALYRAEVPS